jgi:hypothetical protein
VERGNGSGHERILCGPGTAVNGLEEDGARPEDFCDGAEEVKEDLKE